MQIKAVRHINELEYNSGIYTELNVNCICISILYDVLKYHNTTVGYLH